MDAETKAKLDAKTRDALPTSAFAYIDSKGGKHLPIHDAEHTRAALARFDQTTFESDAAKQKAMAKIEAACKKFGIDMATKSDDLDNAEEKDDTATEGVEYKLVPFEMEAGTDLDANEFKGHCAVFGNVDAAGDIIPKGAFKNVLQSFLDTGAVYFNHGFPAPAGAAMPIGKPLDAHEDEKGLFIKGKVSDTAQGRDVLTLMRDGVIKSMSIGYVPKKPRFLTHDEGKSMFGQAGYKAALDKLPANRARIRVLDDFKMLFDASLVTNPCNPQAGILGVKTQAAGGLTFNDQFSAVQDANGEMLARFRELRDLRAKEGRSFSESKMAQLTQMKDAIAGYVSELDDLIASAAPEAKAADINEDQRIMMERARAEHVRFLATQARLNGVLLPVAANNG